MLEKIRSGILLVPNARNYLNRHLTFQQDMFSLHCRDVGLECDCKTYGGTKDELFSKIKDHFKNNHKDDGKIPTDEELKKKIENLSVEVDQKEYQLDISLDNYEKDRLSTSTDTRLTGTKPFDGS